MTSHVDGVRFAPKRVAIGGRVSMSFVLRSQSRNAQDLLVDLAVHFVTAGGKPSKKVFKLKRVSLPPRGHVELTTTVSLAVHTTRKPNPGKHVVDVLVNGEAFRAGSFDVTARRR